MIHKWLAPSRLIPFTTRSLSTTQKLGNIIDGKGLARDIKQLLRKEVKIWSERTLP